MKPSVLMALVKEGKKPMVRLTDVLWDDSFGQSGMIARVVSAADAMDDLIEFDFDYNEYREHNLALDQPNWHLKEGRGLGTALEAGHFPNPDDIHEKVLFDPKDPVPVELLEEKTPLGEYLISGSELPYVEWLEGKLVRLETEVDRLNSENDKYLREIHGKDEA